MTRILHLSDLHFTTVLQAETALSQLSSDLKGEMRLRTLDAIVVSGDSTDFAQSSEFDASAIFVTALCEELHVASENVLIVPGNHDVDWGVARKSYSVVRASQAPASSVSRYQDPANRDYVEVVTDAGLYGRRFENFAHYHQAVTSRSYSLEYEEQFQVVASVDESVILVGLNSAWNLDHYYPDRSSIEAGALNRALAAAKDKARQLGPGSRIIAVWHHPIRGDGALRDISFFQRLIVDNFVAALHGHVHKPESDQFNYEWSAQGRRLFVLGAGTLDSPDVSRGYPWHYSLVSLAGDRLEVRSRGKSERAGAWRSDAQYLVAPGESPVDVLRLELVPSGPHPGAEFQTSDSSFSVGRRIKPLRTIAALKAHLEGHHYDAMGYRIATEALIFDPNGKLLLQERGPESRDEVGRLECLGGQVVGDDLIDYTVRRVRELVGADVHIEVDELLDVQPARFVEHHGPEDWIVVSYLCRLISGEPRPVDPARTAELRWLDLAELHAISDNQLSRSTSRNRDVYRVRFRTNPYFALAGRPA